MKQTNTQKIFANSAPYTNSCQGPAKRLVFVCSVGMLRSPTAAAIATAMGYNARSCGSDVDIALIPLSVNLINWADYIIFMKRENYNKSLKTFTPVGYDQDIIDKSLIFDIDDHYNYGDDYLKKIIADKLNNLKL